MELSRFRKRLKISKEAHKLLKDKQDELMRRFILLLKEVNVYRSQLNNAVKTYSAEAGLSVANFPYKMVENLFIVKETLISAEIGKKNWMGVSVVDIKFDTKEPHPHGALISSPLLSKITRDIRDLLPLLLQLTIAEKNCGILSKEIETLRRRVNALEYMIIPDLVKNIKVIRMKLSDGERDTITRLIKIKSLEKATYIPPSYSPPSLS
jgi:V/A-type H+-transporting ATPase subunit D